MDTLTVSKQVEDFFSTYKKVHFKKGSLLIRTQEEPAGIFYLDHGKVKQYAISKKGEELVVNMYLPHAFFPMTWGMNAGPNHYDFEAVEDVEVYIVPREEVLAFLQKNPDIAMDLLRRILSGIDGVLLRMSYLLSGGAYKRTVTELIIAAKRFGKPLEDSKEIRLRIKETDIATQSGLSRETVSRQISILKRRSVVKFEKGILTIPSLSDLEKELILSQYE